jgi:hypothetical protein
MANGITRASAAARRVDPSAYLRVIEALTQAFANLEAGAWQAADVGDNRADPVFIVGFPRSGTTLLDTILQTHGDVQVLEEMPTVHRLESEFLGIAGRYGDAVIHLDAAQAGVLRQAYFEELDRHIPRERRAPRHHRQAAAQYRAGRPDTEGAPGSAFPVRRTPPMQRRIELLPAEFRHQRSDDQLHGARQCGATP